MNKDIETEDHRKQALRWWEAKRSVTMIKVKESQRTENCFIHVGFPGQRNGVNSLTTSISKTKIRSLLLKTKIAHSNFPASL